MPDRLRSDAEISIDESYEPLVMLSAAFAACEEAVASKAEADPQAAVLVHCDMGHNRSPSLVLAFLLMRGLSLREAYRTLLAARPTVDPLPSYRRALCRLELAQRGSCSIKSSEEPWAKHLTELLSECGDDVAKVWEVKQASVAKLLAEEKPAPTVPQLQRVGTAEARALEQAVFGASEAVETREDEASQQLAQALLASVGRPTANATPLAWTIVDVAQAKALEKAVFGAGEKVETREDEASQRLAQALLSSVGRQPLVPLNGATQQPAQSLAPTEEVRPTHATAKAEATAAERWAKKWAKKRQVAISTSAQLRAERQEGSLRFSSDASLRDPPQPVKESTAAEAWARKRQERQEAIAKAARLREQRQAAEESQELSSALLSWMRPAQLQRVGTAEARALEQAVFGASEAVETREDEASQRLAQALLASVGDVEIVDPPGDPPSLPEQLAAATPSTTNGDDDDDDDEVKIVEPPPCQPIEVVDLTSGATPPRPLRLPLQSWASLTSKALARSEATRKKAASRARQRVYVDRIERRDRAKLLMVVRMRRVFNAELARAVRAGATDPEFLAYRALDEAGFELTLYDTQLDRPRTFTYTCCGEEASAEGGEEVSAEGGCGEAGSAYGFTWFDWEFSADDELDAEPAYKAKEREGRRLTYAGERIVRCARAYLAGD